MFKVTVDVGGFFKIMRADQESPGLHLIQGYASLGNIIKHVVCWEVLAISMEFFVF
jgi:hypothetical protein